MFYRFPNYHEDQKVFKFINSDECQNFDDLHNFLGDNNLPWRTRWIYYFFGKKNWIDDETINNMGEPGHDNYGPYLYDTIYWWERFLADENKIKNQIRDELKEEGKLVNSLEVQEIFIDRAWEYINNMSDAARQDENDRLLREDREFDNDNYYNRNDEAYCAACSESPCACSDPERTSTL